MTTFWWQQQDRKVLKRINTLITDIQRNGNEGIGKPEPLKHGFQGYWSRRITDEHRLVYKVIDDEIRIAACRYHYERLPEPYSARRCHGQLYNLGMPARTARFRHRSNDQVCSYRLHHGLWLHAQICPLNCGNSSLLPPQAQGLAACWRLAVTSTLGRRPSAPSWAGLRSRSRVGIAMSYRWLAWAWRSIAASRRPGRARKARLAMASPSASTVSSVRARSAGRPGLAVQRAHDGASSPQQARYAHDQAITAVITRDALRRGPGHA